MKKLIPVALLILLGANPFCPECDSIVHQEWCSAHEVTEVVQTAEAATEEIAEAVKEEVMDEDEDPLTYVGNFKITYYDACVYCCGNTNGITASGTKATVGRTVSADPNVLPLGTHILIDDVEYVVEDTGSAIKGNILDVFVGSHEEALQLGVNYKDVYLIEGR